MGRWIGGGTPSKANPQFWTGGNIPWVSPKDMKADVIVDAHDHITEEAVAQSATNLVDIGSVLIVVRSGILQHTLPVAVTRGKVALNQDLKAVKPREDVDAAYLAHALKAFERDILHTCTKTGTTVQSLELPVFLRFRIPVAPLPEQHRIVAKIEKQFTRLDAGVAALRQVQANLKRYRAAVLKVACEGRLVPTEAELASSAGQPLRLETGEQLLDRLLTERRERWSGRGKYKEPATPDVGALPSVPSGWAIASIDQIALETLIGLDRGRAEQRAELPLGAPYLKMNNVTMDGKVLLDSLVCVPATGDEVSRFSIEDGDILFNTRNSKELVGKVGLVRRPPLRCVYNNNLMRIRLSQSVSPDFLVMQMCSRGFRERLELVKKATTNVAAIYAKDLLPLAIALPPCSEQERIVEEVGSRLSTIEALEVDVTGSLHRAVRLRQSILQKAFAGELLPPSSALPVRVRVRRAEVAP